MGGQAAVVLSGIVQYLNQLNVQLPEAADGKMLNSPSCSTSSLLDPVWAAKKNLSFSSLHKLTVCENHNPVLQYHFNFAVVFL